MTFEEWKVKAESAVNDFHSAAVSLCSMIAIANENIDKFKLSVGALEFQDDMNNIIGDALRMIDNA